MRYASTYDKSGAPVVAELRGDLLVPLGGLTELGEAEAAARKLPPVAGLQPDLPCLAPRPARGAEHGVKVSPR